MSLFDFFKSNEDDARKSYIKELIRVARADGHLEQREYNFLLKVGKKLDYSPDEIQKLSSEKQDDLGDIRQYKKHRLKLILDLVAIMMIDESIDPKELGLCKSVAMKSGFEPEVIDDIVHRISQEVKAGHTVELASKRVLHLYSQA